jgi:hypothetical protein
MSILAEVVRAMLRYNYKVRRMDIASCELQQQTCVTLQRFNDLVVFALQVFFRAQRSRNIAPETPSRSTLSVTIVILVCSCPEY